MKIKTSELTGAALDWAVCVALGHRQPVDEHTHVWLSQRRYSTDWSQGGPIVERERIDVASTEEGWYANMFNRMLDGTDGYTGTTLRATGDGPTPLVAAMRCYVASKLGDEVDVPDELCEVNP